MDRETHEARLANQGIETSICAFLKTSCFSSATHGSHTMEAGGGVAGINRP
jgi:hypothetical protein